MRKLLILFLGATLYMPCVLGENATLDTIIRQHKKETYNERNKWIYVRLRHTEQDAEQTNAVRIQQSISMILNFDGSQSRMDSSNVTGTRCSMQLLTSAKGTTYHFNGTTLRGGMVDDMVAISESIATMCRLLTWPADRARYRFVGPRNRIDVDLGNRYVLSHFDPKTNLLVSSKVSDSRLGRFGAFQLSEHSWTQGICFPRTWDYSDANTKISGKFHSIAVYLLVDWDESCFTRDSLNKPLQEYLKDAIQKNNMTSLSKIQLTDKQKKTYANGFIEIQKRIADMEKKYADEPEKLKEASKALMDEWKLQLQAIKADDKASVVEP